MRRLLAPLALLVAVGHLSAAPPERTHDITPADYASVNTITEIALSPDGKQVAYVLATWDKKTDRRNMQLWVVDTDGKGKPKQLTNDNAGDGHPKWSADGKSIYTLAKRGEKAKPQVWRVPLDGGKPVAATSAQDGVTAYDYAPKADTIFFTVDGTTTDDDDFAALRKKFDKIDYGHGKRAVSSLYAADKSGVKAVLSDNRYIREFAVTADGKKVAMVSAIDDSVIKSEGESRVDVWEGGKITTPPTDVYRAKAASPYAWLEGLAWNPDGTRFALCAIFDAYPAEIIVGEMGDPNRPEILNINEFAPGKWITYRMPRKKVFNGANVVDGTTQVRGYGSPLAWSDGRYLRFISDAGGMLTNRRYDFVHSVPWSHDPNVDKSEVVYSFDVRGNDVRCEVVGGASRLPILRSIVESKPIDLLDPNPHTANWKFPTIEHITWTSADKATVGGPLELPFGWKKGDKPLPLVVAIHGGPTTASYNDMRFDPHNGRLYFAAKGYAVLCPNYRGSTGYGDKFLTDLVGNENDLDVKDIIAGIQHLIKEGIADPDRVAVMGWSNGGYLTNCLITMKNPPVKIRAASSGAGILDTVAEWGFNDEPAYPIVFKKGQPWEKPDIYKQTSPIYGIGNVTTPTLIHVGGNDVRCPPGHSRMLYRALKEYKNVPTQLCEYPGQPHGLGTLTFRTAKMEWDLAWFEKYLAKK